MAVETAIVAILNSSESVTALVSGRIFPNVIPQDSVIPAVAYKQINGRREHTMSGAAGLVNSGYEIISYALTYSEAKSLSEAIRTLLNGYKGIVEGVDIKGIFLKNEFDVPSFKPGTDLLTRYGKSLTFSVWFRE